MLLLIWLMGSAVLRFGERTKEFSDSSVTLLQQGGTEIIA
jgi:hypothetical protein